MKNTHKQFITLPALLLVALTGLSGCKTTTAGDVATPATFNACVDACNKKFNDALDAGRSAERQSEVKNSSYLKCNESCKRKATTAAAVSTAASASKKAY